MSLIQCCVCGCDVIAIQKTHKYCGPCRIRKARERERERKRHKQDVYKYRKYDPVEEAVAAAPVVPKRPRVSRLRYATLAATPEVPAEDAARGEKLTGGASAVSYAQSVRLVGAGI